MLLQILMATSFVIAGYQDVKDRLVSDLVWIPAIAGVALTLYFVPSQDILLLIRIAIVGALAFGITKYGAIGEADAIALVLVVADPTPLAPIPALFAIAIVALSHIGYLYISGVVGKPKVIGIKQFRSEARWIPRAVILAGNKVDVDKNVNVSRESVDEIKDESAMVEVQYGVPTVAYIAGGYLIYIAYLAIFHPSVLLTLP